VKIKHPSIRDQSSECDLFALKELLERQISIDLYQNQLKDQPRNESVAQIFTVQSNNHKHIISVEKQFGKSSECQRNDQPAEFLSKSERFVTSPSQFLKRLQSKVNQINSSIISLIQQLVRQLKCLKFFHSESPCICEKHRSSQSRITRGGQIRSVPMFRIRFDIHMAVILDTNRIASPARNQIIAIDE
jgi:hypothetical protein